MCIYIWHLLDWALWQQGMRQRWQNIHWWSVSDWEFKRRDIWKQKENLEYKYTFTQKIIINLWFPGYRYVFCMDLLLSCWIYICLICLIDKFLFVYYWLPNGRICNIKRQGKMLFFCSLLPLLLSFVIQGTTTSTYPRIIRLLFVRHTLNFKSVW